MIKLKYILFENSDSDVIKKLAHQRGYTIETFRGDVFADEISVYSGKDRREHGIFTTPISKIAKIYARNHEPRKFYVRAPRVLDLTDDSIENVRWVNNWGEVWEPWNDPQSGEETNAWDVLYGGRMFDYEGDWSSERWMDIQKSAEDDGFDAVILPDWDSEIGVFPSLVVFDERNLKLADVITYDDHRNPIPIEKRFDKSSDDIRY